ncbi:hypothetical protein AA313_de0205399 [Arthrobotrys entomopaga]|nr:hypothetical protein AA313_de0205399 [Arthrobotrys entomopaga]
MSVHASGSLRCRFIKNFPLCIDVEYEVDHPWLGFGGTQQIKLQKNESTGFWRDRNSIGILRFYPIATMWKRNDREEQRKRRDEPACRVDRYEVSSLTSKRRRYWCVRSETRDLFYRRELWCGSPPTPL